MVGSVFLFYILRRKRRHHLCTRQSLAPTLAASRKTLKGILGKNKNVALLLGNGINYAFYHSKVKSWAALVAKLWNETHLDNTITENYVKKANLSLTEAAEMSEKQFEDIRKIVAKALADPTSENKEARKFFKYLENHDIPIITTNYDKNIINELGLKVFNTEQITDEYLTRRFQWGKYYAKTEIPQKDILQKFAVWHAHGTIDSPESICFTLSDYFECGKNAYDVLEGIYSPFYIKPHDREPQFKGTWLDILLNKDLCIAGLMLNENEIFLRLLLMLRFNYMRNHLGNSHKHKGWYLYTNDAEMPRTKRFFLKSVNIQPVKCKNYKVIYNLS